MSLFLAGLVVGFILGWGIEWYLTRERIHSLEARGRRRASAQGAPVVREAYCMRCRAKRVMKDPRELMTQSGRPALTGTCPECGTTMFVFIKGGA